VTPSTLQRELHHLVESGILEKRTDGNRIYYRSDIRCPFLTELQGLLIKTVGVVGQLKQALKPLSKRIDAAFIFGSFAQSSELVTSDIDLMIIGSVGLLDVAPILRKVEDVVARSINPVILDVSEARQKLRSGDHFVNSVAKANKVFLLGEQSELGKAFSGPESQVSQNESPGN
jgi:predicted nucleotidyltransferase